MRAVGARLVILLVVLIAVALGVARMRSYRRRGQTTVAALGLSFNRRELGNVGAGLAIAAIAIGVVFLVAYVARGIAVTGVGSATALGGDILSFVMVPFQEELVFRSALLGGLLVLWPDHKGMSILASAAVFGGLHLTNAHATLLGALGSTIGGIAYGIAFVATEGLWLSLGLHFGWNYFQGPVFGFAVSGAKPHHGTLVLQQSVGPAWFTGGEYGPEGGVVGLVGRAVVLLLLFAWIAYGRPRRSGHG